jgi:sugar (pentulose or hexulose) kinase
MAASYLLALDAGSSGGRCLIVDERGRTAACASEPWGYVSDPEAGPQSREFSPDRFWAILSALVRRTLAEAGLERSRIAGVSATSQRLALVFLDAQGRELYAGPNQDARALSQGLALEAKHGERLYSSSGHWPAFLMAPARLLWLREQRPDLFERVATVLTLADWVLYRLTGERAGERALAGDAGLIDITQTTRCDEMWRLAGLDERLLPPLVSAGERVGRVTSAAVAETGLAPGTAVYAGGPDSQCALAALGAWQEGDTAAVTGWSGTIQVVTAQPVIDPERRAWAGLHVGQGRWVVESNVGEAGGLWQWWVDLLVGQGSEALAEADCLAGRALPGSGDVLAFLGVAPLSVRFLGARLGGLLLPVPLILRRPSRDSLLRAVLENVAFALRGGLETLETVTGLSVAEVRLGGGMTRSAAFVRLLADIIGRRLRVASVPEVSALGAAMCAAVGAGLYGSFAEAQAMAPPLSSLEPDPAVVADYQDFYRRWQGLDAALREAGAETY